MSPHPSFKFTGEELSLITPDDLIKWMTFKLYNKEAADLDEIPVRGSHFSIDFYKKSISYFMPHKDQKWDPVAKRGNPTRSKEVNAFINRIRDIDIKTGGSKKRKSMMSMDASMEEDSTSGAMGTPAKQLLAVTPVTKGGVHGVLQRMHAQNVQLINTFHTMNTAIDNMKKTLQANNQAITAEMATLPLTTPSTSRLVNLCNVAEGAAAASAGAMASATKPTSFGFDSDIAFDAQTLGWHYVHPDGTKRRMPANWQFPLGNLEEMYILWHCGDIQNRLAPMSTLTTADVAFLGKRARINLSDLRYIINIVDEEAKRKGKAPAATGMTLSQALQCFQAGFSAIQSCAAATTPGGRQRNIMRLKWNTLMSYVKNGKKSGEDELTPQEANEKALQELAAPSPNDTPGDEWWYVHDDGFKRRVPSTYTFPMLSIEEMYVIWHCGMPEQKISPMRFFTPKDLSWLADRSRKNLGEVRSLMAKVDLEAARQGIPPMADMTVSYARQCCRAGLHGLNFHPTTQSGRPRDIGQMKWSSVARNKDFKLASESQQDGEEEEEEVQEEEEEEGEEEGW